MNFEDIYKRLFKPVFAYIQSRVYNSAHAEDIAARTWQKIWDKQDQFDATKGLPEQWIFTIARNEVNNHHRWQQLKQFFLLSEEEIVASNEKTPFEQLSAQERTFYLLRALKKLEKREQDLLALKFYSQLNNRQIAQMTGISESNVGTLLHRALGKLRKILEDV